jgi:hypothetical protein
LKGGNTRYLVELADELTCEVTSRVKEFCEIQKGLRGGRYYYVLDNDLCIHISRKDRIDTAIENIYEELKGLVEWALFLVLASSEFNIMKNRDEDRSLCAGKFSGEVTLPT